MKKVFFASVLLLFSLSFVFSQVIKDGDEPLSPFVGTWRWVEDNDEQWFAIFVGERNDSLLFAICGVFECGNKIQISNYDLENNDIAEVCVKKKDTKIVRSKIHSYNSSFFFPDKSK